MRETIEIKPIVISDNVMRDIISQLCRDTGMSVEYIENAINTVIGWGNHSRTTESNIKDMIHEFKIKNYHNVMNEWMYDVVDFFDDIEDYILPKVKPLFNQVHSKRPINNPIAGRCY